MRFWWGSLLLGLLIILLLHQSCVEGYNRNGPSVCCFSFYNGAILLQNIMKYEKTRSDCPKAAVLFSTWSGARVCMDPTRRWVKQTMEKIDKRALGS